jgi:DNA-binding transcriptional MerR regulator
MYNIETLAKMTGLTRRTIRYYVQRGLLDPPLGGGRGSFYTDEHLNRLKKIAEWTEQGVPLIHMKTMLEGKKPQIHVDMQTGTRTVLVSKYEITGGIDLYFRPGQLSSEDLEQIRKFIKARL